MAAATGRWAKQQLLEFTYGYRNDWWQFISLAPNRKRLRTFEFTAISPLNLTHARRPGWFGGRTEASNTDNGDESTSLRAWGNTHIGIALTPP